MNFRKRLGTGILAVMMAVSSVQFPGGLSYAAEWPADSSVDVQEMPAQMETAEDRMEISQDLPGEETGQSDIGSGDDNKSGEEDIETDGTEQAGEPEQTIEPEQAGYPDPADSVSDKKAEESSGTDEEREILSDEKDEKDESSVVDDALDSEETVSGEQVSGNDVSMSAVVEEKSVSENTAEVFVEEELEGVYQFGGAPSAGGRASTMSLSTYAAGAETYLYQQLKARQETIDVSAYNIEKDSLKNLVSGVLNEHPDLYFVKNGWSFSVSGTKVLRITFELNETLDDIAVQSAVNEALAMVKAGMSDLEKAIVLHDYLVINCEYDKINYDAETIPDESYTIYGVFANRTAVCEGYALAYKYLLNQVGIDCYMVSSSSMGHAWNMIVLDGKYYQVDVTWDDPVWDQIGRAVHTYMFRSDTAFEGHSNWQVTSGSEVVNYKAADTKYDSAFWTKCRSPLVITGDDCYYVSSVSRAVMKTSLAPGASLTNVGTSLISVGQWPAWEGNGYWEDAYSGLFLTDGRLFYNDKSSIYSIDLDGTDKRTEFTANTSTGYIYGSAYCQGEVRYALHQEPNLSAKEEVLVADIVIEDVALNLANLQAQYTALDGTKISSAANGRPKLLVFYKSGCWNCQTSITSIRDSINDFSGVDIYAIEISSDTKENVSQYQGQYGCDEIVFSYDTGSTNANSMWNYLRSSGFSSSSAATPVICYIDADNRFQYITQSISTADTVLSNLKKYCKYVQPAQGTYTITYVLNGGTNHQDNPGTYTSETEGIILKDASREGYRFDGWYEDAAYQKKITSIQKGHTGNITLYAKWLAASGGNDLPKVAIEPSDNKIVVKFKGEYDTDSADKLLGAINKIRETAWDPKEMGEYEPLKWSADLEAISRLRAAETSVKYNVNERPNGERWNGTVTNKGVHSDQEWLSWSKINLLDEITSYQSKALEDLQRYVPEILNPNYHYVGAGCFKLNDGTVASDDRYRVVMEFSKTESGWDERKDDSAGTCEQDMEIAIAAVENLQFVQSNESAVEIKKEDSYQLSLQVTVKGENTSHTDTDYTGIYQAGGKWSSSDNTVATVDGNGIVRAVSAGSCTVTVEVGGKNAKCLVTVTEENDGPLNLANLQAQYTALDGTKISSSANGKPKLLIFYKNNCGNCQTSIKSIRDSISKFGGVDIYAIETSNGTKESVSQFQKQYGCDEIVFSYDTGSTNNSSMRNYLQSSGYSSSSAVTPVICYIDADNRFQYITQSVSTADTVLSNLKKYCKYVQPTQVTYNITYVLGDGINHQDNPATYTSETEDIILKDASWEGHRFDGWYEDAYYQKKVTTIPKGHTGDIILYAKWTDALAGNLPTIDLTLADGNVVVGFRGEYKTASAEEILKELNDIRNEAYENGETKQYIPLKWSADLEAIARLRAVEVSVNNDTNKRPNGGDYYSVKTNNNISASMELMGYSLNDLLTEIKTDGRKAFRQYIIDPNYKYVGVGAFKMDGGTDSPDDLYRVVTSLSTRDNLDESKDSSSGKCVRNIEVAANAVQKLQFDAESTGMKKGDTRDLPLHVTVKGKKIGNVATDYTGIYHEGGTWSSSDETVATVDRKGVVTGRAAGKTTVTLKVGKKTASTDVFTQSEFGNGTNATLRNSIYTYNGWEQRPKVTVTVSDIVLKEGEDYELSYQNNINVGSATVTVTGMRYYCGSVSRNFEIEPAPLVVRAKDKAILTRSRIPSASQYEYEADGLCTDDKLSRKPSFSCDIASTSTAGLYEIIPSGADAGDNYEITYESGWLRVADELVSHIVSFDMQGHGEAVADYFGVRTGATIEQPADPSEKGYRFGGWFKDAACTKAWNFDTDIVQSDMTLYAGWFGAGSNGSFALQEIADVSYTGKAQKPIVNVYDGDILLKAGRDYQVKYYNNVNANNVRKTGNGQGVNFKETLPYVEIVGKGDYTETLKVNFNILKASIGNGGERAAAGVALKMADQLVKTKKVQKPFQSMKYSTAMKLDRDFTLSLKPVSARDESGKTLQSNVELENAEIPANCEGEFQLLIQGTGNYEGTIRRTVLVADKEHMLKNAKITLGKNLKNISYTDEIKLTPSEKNSDDTFTVKCGKTLLKPGIDYVAKYDRHPKPGKAALTVIGTNGYAGSKTITFNVKGKTFSTKTVEVDGIEDKTYTGRAQTQNGVTLTYHEGDGAEQRLVYGTDYTISYSGNVNKGTASMIFKGKDAAGFSGSFKKTFKITAADLSQKEQVTCKLQNTAFSYCKAGVEPADALALTNREGFVLRMGKDYTLKYKNNKAVAKASAPEPPTVMVVGKGNYMGSLDVPFSIDKAKLTADNIKVKAAPLAFQDGKAESYRYTPGIKVMDGKTALRAGTDYEIDYKNNTQEECETYVKTWRSGSTVGSRTPRVIISQAEGADYQIVTPIVIPLPVYQHKLTKSNLEVQIGETIYTGGQATPEVQVYYLDEGSKKVLLREDRDYSLTYGANVKSGKNKGTVCISGIAPSYGGDVTVKFEIQKKPISGKVFN